MIKLIKNLLSDLTNSRSSNQNLTEEELHLVTAALMTEVMLSDGSSSGVEKATLRQILTEDFCFSPTEVDEFVTQALAKVQESTSLFEFTDIVNRHFDADAKFNLISHLWSIAQADGVIHKLEEATIRKISCLIYLPHSEFIRAKLIHE